MPVAIVDAYFEVKDESYRRWEFTVRPNYKQARVVGHIQVEKGGKKDIRVMIGRENDEPVYNEMVYSSGSLDLRIEKPGDYSIVFSNEHARVKNKKVSAKITLMYK